MLKAGDILQERYEIRSTLGKGGYGAVYEAYHLHLKHTVAIKEMQHRSDPDFANRFEQEARMLSQLQHPALPKVSDFFLENAGFYFVMDYIPGKDLGEYVQEQPDNYLDVNTALRLITPVLEVLAYLHTQQPPVIHRDIKPANIRITHEGKVYLVDFGIARIYDPNTKTSTAAQAVTPGFSPLEQYQRGATEPRSDLYAVGATLYYMLSGITPPDAVQRTQTDPLAPLSHLNSAIPGYLEDVIHRLLSVYPNQRYQDIRSVQQALAQPHGTIPGKEPIVTDFDKINTFRRQLQQNIAKRKAKKHPTILEHASLKALETILNRLNRIEQLLHIEKYDLVFIGQIATGKTTAICHLLDLVYEDTVTKKGKGQKARRIQVIRELLTTGSGRTTICEVVIQPAQTTALEIEPYEEQELTTLIEEFCTYIWTRAYPESVADDVAAPQPLPAELDRAVRNITGLQHTRVGAAGDQQASEDEPPDEPVDIQTKSVSMPKATRIDKALELAKQFEADQFERFYDEVVAHANISQRTETRTEYNPSQQDGETEEQWLRDTFDIVNLGKKPGFSIPQRILIFLSPNLLKIADYPRFASVIDTRGLDGDRDRPDLQAYIRDSDNALCIFTDLFLQAPTKVAELMKRYLTAESPDIVNRSLLMVLTRSGDPEKTVGPDGAVDDRDEGIAVRREQVETVLDAEKIKLPSDNIIFYDALQYYRTDDKYYRRDEDYDEDDIKDARKYIFDAISTAIETRHSLLWEEVHSLESRFQDIQKSHGLSLEDEQLIIEVKDNLKGYRQLIGMASDTFINQYLESWMPKHVMRLRATNRRHGIYKYGNINIYFSASAVTAFLIRGITEAHKNEIRQEIARIEKEASARVDLQPLVRTFLDQIDRDYEQFIEIVGESVLDYLKAEVFAPQSSESTFWQSVENRWGKGPGYKHDVISMYQAQLEDEEVPWYLQQRARERWSEFLDGILAFFG